jgi:hypothetical protein
MISVFDRLSFGRAIPDGGEVTDADWRAFEAGVVAPRFPAGFTSYRAEGAWRDATTGETIREPTIVLEVAHDGSPEVQTALNEVAQTYKSLFRQDAVMRATIPVRVDFI